MGEPVVLIKLGGSVITDKKIPYKANIEHLHALAKIIKQIRSPLLIAHGSGSFGHTSAAKYGGAHGYKSLWGVAKVAHDATAINALVMESLLNARIPAVSFRPMSFLTAQNGDLHGQYLEPLELAFNQGLVPVIYGDVIWDKTWGSTIFSGETTLGVIAHYLKRKQEREIEIVELCNTSGVLDESGLPIVEITPKNWKSYLPSLFITATTDVTGGMLHKVEEALELSQKGITTRIIDGSNLTDVSAALLKKQLVGTLIHA